MLRQRTTPILVIAILHLVGGGIGLLGSLCGIGSLLMVNSLSSLTPPTLPARPGQPAPPVPPSPDEMVKRLNAQIPGYRAYTIVSLGASLLLDIMLLTAGIGLLSVQPWARWLSVVYAVISIFNRLGVFIYSIIWVIPATKALYANAQAPPGFSSIMTISSGIGVFVGLFFIIYPIAVLFVMLMPSTGAAFRGEIPVRKEDDGDDEEGDDDDDWRRPSPRSDKFRQ